LSFLISIKGWGWLRKCKPSNCDYLLKPPAISVDRFGTAIALGCGCSLRLGSCCWLLLVVVVRMYQSELEESLAIAETPEGLGLWYDAERLILEGAYLDEITAYRARRRWIQTFETNFLLEGDHDFRLKVVFEDESGRFFVRCSFLTACGRYAFWRLTHHQAPEVQFMLETAHLPFVAVCPPHADSFASDAFEDVQSLVFHSKTPTERKRSTFEKLLCSTRACVKSFVQRFIGD
jgi:hypothetical protein